MRVVSRIVVAVLALMMFAAPVAVADEGKGGSDRRPSVVPAGHVAGNTGGRLLGDWFVQNLSRPADASPFGGAANLCLDIGRHGKVLSPAGGIQDATTRLIEMTCTVKVGRPVVLVMTSADCSTAEAPPFFGASAREQRACAVGFLNSLDIRSINVSVDGGRPVDIHQRRFFEVSPQRHVVFPENAVFGARPGPATFVAAAWIAEIRGMKRGNHTVNGTMTLVSEDQTIVYPFIVHFKVVRR